jgi:hypothetical protein
MPEDSPMTMWTPKADVESDFSNLPGTDLPNKPRRSRRRAWRDGLAEQTVAKNFEDIRAYRAFERALIGSVDPRSAIELALVHRLANLLWRLRRASAIETALFEIQGEALLVRRAEMSRGHLETLQASARANGHDKVPDSNGPHEPPANDREPLSTSTRPLLEPCSKFRAIAQRFLRLSNLDPTLLDRVGRYEARLWRQAAQTIWTLDAMRRPQPASARRPARKPVARFYWDAER